ncbi:MAG TPA: hypothetical protein VFM76_05775 [Methylophaga sp.]|nr:hypothetical protein [Methylophaga sp.]
MDMNVIDEKHPSKVAGTFNNEQTAKAAKEKLIKEGHFKASDIKIVHPNDAAISQKIEPKDTGIAKTLVNSHVIFGLAGLAISLIVAFILTMVGPEMFRSSPFQVYFALAFVGTSVGLMVAGGISIRPDQDPLITDTVEASTHNQWSVVVQIENDDDNERAQQLLKETAISVTHTL